MVSRRALLGAGPVLLGAMLLGAAQPAWAAPPAPSVPGAPGPGTPATALLPLQEFRTARGAGWFYTASPAEAQAAVRQHGFAWQRGVGRLHMAAVPGSRPLYRLRYLARSSYLVVGSQAEADRRLAGGGFADEGLIGHVDGEPGPGSVRLMRFSNNQEWRLAPESETAAQRAAGYDVDGPVGWVLPLGPSGP
jgi:hypothetical protein